MARLSIRSVIRPWVFAALVILSVYAVSRTRAEGPAPAFSFKVESRGRKIGLTIKNVGSVTVEQAGISFEFDGKFYYASLGSPIGAAQERMVTADTPPPARSGSYPIYIKLYYYLEGRRFTSVYVDYINVGQTAILDAPCSLQNFELGNKKILSLTQPPGHRTRLVAPEEVKIASIVEAPAVAQYYLERGSDSLQPSYQVFQVITAPDSIPAGSPYKTRICPATLTLVNRGALAGLSSVLRALGFLVALGLVLLGWLKRRQIAAATATAWRKVGWYSPGAAQPPAGPDTNFLQMVRILSCIFFFSSGAAALIYELIWVRILGLVFGNTTYAVTTVLAVYMAGLGLGSYFFGRAVDRWSRPLRAYGLLELTLGIYAAFTFVYVIVIEKTFVFLAQAISDNSAFLTAARFLLSTLILFAPTLLMGGTLPVLIRFFVASETEAGARTGLLYGLNTAGAVLGTLLAGFFFIPKLGLKETLTIAVSVNVIVGALAFACSRLLASRGMEERPKREPGDAPQKPASQPSAVYGSMRWLPPALFVSGALAMIYEVAWTRVFALVVGSSTYAFSLMLTTFLLGLALGSYFYKKRLAAGPPAALEWPLLVLLISIFCMATLPWYEEINIWSVRIFGLTGRNYNWFTFAQFILLSLFMIVPALGFGGLFPLGVALYAGSEARVGRDVGSLYLANTAGNIVGSLLVGFVFISLWGIHDTFLAAIAIGGALALILTFIYRKQSPVYLTALLALFAVFAGLYPSARRDWNPQLMASSLMVHPEGYLNASRNDVLKGLFEREVLYYREGLQSIVSINETATGRYLNVNGKTDASTNIKGDMTTQLLMGHLPAMLNQEAKTALVIGFGSGTTLASLLAHPVNEVDLVEIEPSVRYGAHLFSMINRRAYLDPRAKIIFNDARNYLLITAKRYDIIASEPSNPWMAGVGNLFTREFYRLAKKNLSAGGIFCQWLQKYNLSPKDYQMVIATVRGVFPYITIWRASSGDSLLIASDTEARFDLDGAQSRYDKYPLVKEDLKKIGVYGAAGILSYFTLGNDDISRFIEHARLNTDNLPLLEFEAPKSLHINATEWIDKILMAYRTKDMRSVVRYPEVLVKQPEAIADIGLAYLAIDDVNKSSAYFDMALKLDAASEKAWLGKGLLKIRNKQVDDAMNSFNKVLERNPNSVLANVYLGIALSDLRKFKESLPYLDKALAGDNNNWETVKAKVTALTGLGRVKEGLPLYQYLIQLQPLELNLLVIHARAVNLTQGPQSAIELLEKYRRQHPYLYSIYREIKKFNEELGQPYNSIRIYEELVKRNPYNFQYWTDLIELYRAAGYETKAKHAIEEATDSLPNFTDLLRFGVL